jgi:hypothetical protein
VVPSIEAVLLMARRTASGYVTLRRNEILVRPFYSLIYEATGNHIVQMERGVEKKKDVIVCSFGRQLILHELK